MEVFDPEEAARALTGALRPLGTPGRAAQEKRYLKSDLEFYGVAMPDLRRAVKAAARGWVLREISRRDPGWVATWTERHLPEMSGVTFREAVRRLSPGDAERLRA
jgi:hypothetical protein